VCLEDRVGLATSLGVATGAIVAVEATSENSLRRGMDERPDRLVDVRLRLWRQDACLAGGTPILGRPVFAWEVLPRARERLAHQKILTPSGPGLGAATCWP
jgi:hypothetical protein